MQADQRRNAALSAAVEEGIRLAQSSGSANAWTYMLSHQVPSDAIKRVLAYPNARRTPRPDAASSH